MNTLEAFVRQMNELLDEIQRYPKGSEERQDAEDRMALVIRKHVTAERPR